MATSDPTSPEWAALHPMGAQRQRPSLWTATHPIAWRQPLMEDTQADVCVIGGGLAGLTTAYLLAREGRSVIVLEDGHIGEGMTGRTTAHLSNVIDDRFTYIEKVRGEAGARLAADSHRAAIDMIARIIDSEHIECDFRNVDGYLFLGSGQTPDMLDKELAAARRAGLTVESRPRVPMDGFDSGPALKFSGQAQFHAMAYLDGLLQGCQRHGVAVYTDAHASDIEDGRVQVKNGGQVTARSIVVATNVPVNVRVNLHLKQAAYMSFVVAAKVLKDSFAPALLWDMEDPYHYVRMQPFDDSHDIIVVGGEDRHTGQGAEEDGQRYQRLVEWTQTRFKGIEDFVYAWSGQVMETIDGLAFIGRNDPQHPDMYVITGDSGMGMTHGTIGGLLITDLIMGRPNPWQDLYDPLRTPLKAMAELIKEDAHMAAQYARWAAPAEAAVEDIPVGEGRIIRHGVSKAAAFRDDDGRLHLRSAVCPHLGCMVTWNGGERTWDCPCHGSRFDRYGKVINGPSNQDLAMLDVPSPHA